ncbi:SNF2-related protein [Nitzschia inconspicua]|uniref:SNF2-related protein n=1 Tax=Nitzschia inconspicua TaxID=303405 RepID=A0A9K3PVT0_9STRA|nr:SNF2-related protein [Nitzschia inconspicua]
MNEQTYTILFYKRKNKVHKSKGVSKMDGTLTIQPPPKTTAILKADGNSVIWHGSIATDLAQMGASLQLVDETISLGLYDVEVLSVAGKVIGPMANALKPIIKQSTGGQTLVANSQRSASGAGLLQHRGGVRRKLEPVSTNIPSGVKSSDLKKRSLVNRKPPPQPKKTKVAEDADDCDDHHPSTGPPDLSMKSTLINATNPVLRSRNNLPPIQRPLKTSCVTCPLATEKSSVQSGRKRNSPTALAISSAAVSTAKARTTNDTFFPGAIGNPSVPHCIRKVLQPHQVEGVTFLWNCLTGNGQVKQVSPHYILYDDTDDESKTYKGCILGDAMGLGKSLMTIATICALHKQNRDKRFVVVCPSSLVKNWAHEFDKWIGKASQPKRIVIKGGEEGIKQMKAFCTVKPKYQSEVLIISYDLFRIYQDCLKDIKKVGLLVVDEGHRLKSTGGSLTMTALETLECEARLCITATPIQNNLSDMYTIINFVCPGVLGDLATFRREYERPISASSNRNCTPAQKERGTQAADLLDRITKSLMIRRLQKDVLEKYLPPRHEFLLFCRPTKEQCCLYKSITNTYKGVHNSGHDSPSPEALTALMELRKICTHPHLIQQTADGGTESKTSKRDAVNVDLSGKLKVLCSLLSEIRSKEPSDKIVIVSNFTATLTIIEEYLLKPVNLKFLRLDGSTASANRQPLVDTFNRTNAETYFAMTLSSKAGGVGLNLIGANRIVLVDPDWNPSTDIQAMARIYRQGQKKPCYVYRMFTSGTVEEVICQRQMKKGALVALTVDSESSSKRKKSSRLNEDELRDCFTLKESCSCDTRSKVGNWPDYDGETSLISQECPDSALIGVASQESVESSSLAFVHVVTEHSSMESSDVDEHYYEYEDSDDKEMEFDMDFEGNEKLQDDDTKDSTSSDEEFEFE